MGTWALCSVSISVAISKSKCRASCVGETGSIWWRNDRYRLMWGWVLTDKRNSTGEKPPIGTKTFRKSTFRGRCRWAWVWCRRGTAECRPRPSLKWRSLSRFALFAVAPRHNRRLNSRRFPAGRWECRISRIWIAQTALERCRLPAAQSSPGGSHLRTSWHYRGTIRL